MFSFPAPTEHRGEGGGAALSAFTLSKAATRQILEKRCSYKVCKIYKNTFFTEHFQTDNLLRG